MFKLTKAATTLLAGIAIASSANAAEIMVSGNITTSTTWTADNVYNLQEQIYVTNMATLTIEPGTLIASTSGLGGSLAVTRGSQIFAMGTQRKPIIWTSTADVATWKGGDPRTGSWREASQEWGNLTVMGRAYISEHNVAGNVSTCNANNVGNMEGLSNGPATDQYGGGDDSDDSGTIQWCSFRYGGRTTAVPNVELNGLSLGGIGSETDIHHIDIMNNVDDGIEIWGGTVNLKYFNIWNIGDDSLDCDQGWRGKAQFGLIVQGYSTQSSQGSGTGDNLFEIDGAEDCDWQPVTTTTIYNCTAIGQPVSGDDGTAWRAGARVQYRNCIWMDLGEELVRHDTTDGSPDNSCDYGTNGTITWPGVWTTPFDMAPAHVNDCSPAPLGFDGYNAQSSGMLAEIRDSVFFNNNFGAAYDEATARGVFNPVNDNVLAVSSPIRSITRAADLNYLGLTMRRVTSLDPRPANDAVASVAAAPNDGFFTPAMYRGAFAPDEVPWVCNWTAAAAFGFIEGCKVAVAPGAPGQGGTRLP